MNLVFLISEDGSETTFTIMQHVFCITFSRIRTGAESSTLRRNLTLMQGGSYNVDVPGS